MAPEVPVCPVCNPLEFIEAKRWEVVQDVNGALGIVCELYMLEELNLLALEPDNIYPPLYMVFDPRIVNSLVITGANKVLDFHLLELTYAEQEVPWCDFVAEALTRLSDTKG